MSSSTNIIKVKSNKTGKEYEAIQVKIDKWSKLIFVSPFELDYIKEHLNNAIDDVAKRRSDELKEIYGKDYEL